MNANENAEKSRLERRDVILDRWMYVGMAMVLMGVIAEAVSDFLAHGTGIEIILRRSGEILIAVGLSVEFWVDIRAKRVRAKLKSISDTEYGIVLDRATKAEQATAEANLKREQLQSVVTRRTITRRFTPNEVDDLIKALSAFSGQPFTIRDSRPPEIVPSEKLAERMFFAGQLQDILIEAGWKLTPITLPDFGLQHGVTVFVPIPEGATDSGQGRETQAGQALSWDLMRRSIVCEATFRYAKPEDLEVIVIWVGLL